MKKKLWQISPVFSFTVEAETKEEAEEEGCKIMKEFGINDYDFGEGAELAE